MGLPHHPLETLRPLSESELSEWEEAYAAVEAYLQALRLRNRLLVAELVRAILWRASARGAKEPGTPARVLAMEETLTEIATWTQDVLEEPLEHRRLAARGRLALLLADMPGKWQGVFLTPQPWPPAFTEAMRKSYLAAGPQFAQLTMLPQPLELNVIGEGAARWWETMDRRPIVRKMFAVFALALIGAFLWFIYF
ncbi:hypothetical protein OKA04_16325 [Luteolibacter flavescens]|uniref:Type IV / VI secretion system DotU domain-containing protein n=1 Tax=Luteolibacter flavescens TaxID=1859460 RepID=A0ABT3FRV0_9BACT|nr:hypothetical protein [Luteolibacter flavescens]MCW1886305.1 hypothetical protein [Luteolibacter flavescens]